MYNLAVPVISNEKADFKYLLTSSHLMFISYEETHPLDSYRIKMVAEETLHLTIIVVSTVLQNTHGKSIAFFKYAK